MRKFCAKTSCEIVIIPQNLTNKFQPLDISVNKAAKSFISDKYNFWLANKMSKQLTARNVATDVKVSLKLPVIDLYNTLTDDNEMAINGFRSARITEVTENAKNLVEKVEKPLKEV